jgi:hypothetical protein
VFLLIKNVKNISRTSKISYNRNPVKTESLLIDFICCSTNSCIHSTKFIASSTPTNSASVELFVLMTKFNQNFLSLLREPLSIFRLVSLYWTNRYPWRFDSIHSHSYDDVIIFHSILNILKEFWAIARYRAPLRHAMKPRHVVKISVQAGTRLNRIPVIRYFGGTRYIFFIFY